MVTIIINSESFVTALYRDNRDEYFGVSSRALDDLVYEAIEIIKKDMNMR